jgi:predicted Zn-dependent peptidase
LVRAKNQIRVGLTRSQERGFGLLSSVVDNLFVYGEHPSIVETLAKIDAVTVDDVKAAFARWLASKPSLTILGSGHDKKYYDAVLDHLGQVTEATS